MPWPFSKSGSQVNLEDEIENTHTRDEEFDLDKITDFPIVYRGPLIKQGRLRRNWKLRHFVLRGKFLLYYKNEDESGQPRGIMNIENIIVAEINPQAFLTEEEMQQDVKDDSEEPQAYPHFFSLTSDNRVLIMGAKTKEIMEQWVDNIEMQMISVDFNSLARDMGNLNATVSIIAAKLLNKVESANSIVPNEGEALIINEYVSLTDLDMILRLCHNACVSEITFDSCGLTNAYMPLLSNFLANPMCRLKRLYVKNISRVNTGWNHFFDGLTCNSSITTLILDSCVLGSIDNALISFLLSMGINFEVFGVPNCNLPPLTLVHILEALSSVSIQYLDLSGNNLRFDLVIDAFTSVFMNQSLRSLKALRMNNCELNDESLYLMLTSLCTNISTNSHHDNSEWYVLDIRNNAIGLKCSTYLHQMSSFLSLNIRKVMISTNASMQNNSAMMISLLSMAHSAYTCSEIHVRRNE
ncbi:hypothetical protein PCE1_000182 [Barthelona sp. PCE]